MRIAAAAFLCCGAAFGQSGADQDAARETMIDGLRVVSGVSVGGVRMAYVENDTKPGGGAYTCGGLTRDDALGAATTVASALDALPGEALSRLRLRYVVLCHEAHAAGQRIGGIPVPPLNLLMLDVADDGGALRHRTLHELYHLAEYRGGSVNDAGWNAQFTGYNNSYPGMLRRSPIGGGKPGFVNAYAETFPHEERAELFAFLVLERAAMASHLRGADDVLRKKARYVSDRADALMGMALSVP